MADEKWLVLMINQSEYPPRRSCGGKCFVNFELKCPDGNKETAHYQLSSTLCRKLALLSSGIDCHDETKFYCSINSCRPEAVRYDLNLKDVMVAQNQKCKQLNFEHDCFKVTKDSSFASLKLAFELSRKSQHFAINLSNFYKYLDYADVHFVVKGEKMAAHLLVIYLASPLLAEMFREGRTKQVKIDDVDPEIFKKMLRYVYTGAFPRHRQREVIEALLVAADKYKVDCVRRKCKSALSDTLNLHDAVAPGDERRRMLKRKSPGEEMVNSHLKRACPSV